MRHPTLLVTLAAAALAAAGCSKKDSGAATGSATAAPSAEGKGATGRGVAGPAGPAWDVPPGTYVVDTGFRPAKHGFKFPNEGSVGADPWLTAVEMRKLFGDAVCMPSEALGGEEPGVGSDVPTPAGACVLTPAAEQWMGDKVTSMKDGVCEGMAVAALMLFKKREEMAGYAPGSGDAIELEATAELKRAIGYYFVMQYLDPLEAEAQKLREASTPNDILDKMTELLKGDDPPSFGFYHQAGLGGHAVTPYAIEAKGEGLFWLRVYDNNAPGEERYIEFDRNKNTWQYGFGQLNAGVQADVWQGNAETRSLDYGPLSWRKSHKCPFCEDSGVREVSFHGKGHLVISDASGNKLGVVDGKLVSTLPGARALRVRAYRPGQPPPEPTYFLPGSGGYDILLDGAGQADAAKEEVAIFGNGLVAELDGIQLGADQDDHLLLSADGTSIKYKPGGTESPIVRISFDGKKADYLFQVSDLDVASGEELDFSIDAAKGKLKIFDSGPGGDKYDLRVERYTAKGEETFFNEDIAIGGGEADFVDFDAWGGEGKPLEIETDKGNDGTMDGHEQEPDEVAPPPEPDEITPPPEHAEPEPPPAPPPPPPPPDDD
ncbi:MAG: hypothetical protein HY908_34535 [Myxococcales bacterium]|nr:hypothetical protein [Myxococcales bacterium]